MAKKYFLYANNVKIEVTKEVYIAYYKSYEREKYLEQLHKEKCVYLDDHFEGFENNTAEYKHVMNLMKIQQEKEAEEKLKIKLKGTIELLEDDEKTIINLYFFEDYTQQRIGEDLGVSQQNISKKIEKTLKKLKKLMNF